MKSKELIKSLSLNDLFKISLFSSLGFNLLYFGFGTIFFLVSDANAPITINGAEVSGLKGFLIHLLFMPLYFILIFLFEFIILTLGIWISKKLFFNK